MSCPLQVRCNNDPGLNADTFASSEKLGGCDATGQSAGRTTGSATAAGGGFFRFLFDDNAVFVVVLLAARFTFTFTFTFEFDDGVDLLILRFAETDRFVTEDDFFVVEAGAILIRLLK